MRSSTAELARMTGMDTATATAANASRKASDARRRVVPPPRGPSTTARSRCAVAALVPAAPCPARVATAFLLAVPTWNLRTSGDTSTTLGG